MGICVFCKKNRKLTKEHVTPNFIYKRFKEIGPHEGWNAHVENYKKNFENVVKDVCAECNNGVLSSLDSYGKEFLSSNSLIAQTYTKDFYLHYEYDDLCRWLLKISFNSARVSNDHGINFEHYINYILCGIGKPNHKYFGIAVEAAKPYKYSKDEDYTDIETFKVKNSIYSNPFMFRAYRTLPLDGSAFKSRCVGFGGVYFHLVFIDPSQKVGHAAVLKRKYLKKLILSILSYWNIATSVQTKLQLVGLRRSLARVMATHLEPHARRMAFGVMEPWRRFAHARGDRLNSLRRRLAMLGDQAVVLLRHKLLPPPAVEPFDSDPRFALITVNFSTTRFLKLMLLTLSEQRALALVHRLIIVDNDSKDGGLPFIRELAARVPRIYLLENRRFPTHARGMRLGVSLLADLETDTPPHQRVNLLLFCDTDIIFRNRDTLSDLAQAIVGTHAAFAGELFLGRHAYPEAQASFFAVRRDCYARPDVSPFVHHGAPAYPMQRSLWRAGLHPEHFPSNFGGYILHRGRSAVAATRDYRPENAHATAAFHRPHYMGVPGGERIWRQTEARYEDLLRPANEARLLALLTSRFPAPAA